LSLDWNLLEAAWRPLLEIGILSVGIYWILMFVRRTRGGPVVLGFLALLGLLAFTILLDLTVLSRILRTFFSFSAFAILILFHQEIRRIFATIGSFSSIYSARERRENLETIVQTADRLSDVKIGALIAVEQSIDLDELVESGVTVNCEATAEMLETIFFPNNAIHDGGVIIRGDRIARAACIFPLTRRKDLNKSLGTRHRAAIGLSEESDAVVVAVSEENGMISYAHKGQLIRGISADELRSFLTSILFSDPKPKKRFWARWGRRKNGTKAPLASLSAMKLWVP